MEHICYRETSIIRPTELPSCEGAHYITHPIDPIVSIFNLFFTYILQFPWILMSASAKVMAIREVGGDQLW